MRRPDTCIRWSGKGFALVDFASSRRRGLDAALGLHLADRILAHSVDTLYNTVVLMDKVRILAKAGDFSAAYETAKGSQALLRSVRGLSPSMKTGSDGSVLAYGLLHHADQDQRAASDMLQRLMLSDKLDLMVCNILLFSPITSFSETMLDDIRAYKQRRWGK